MSNFITTPCQLLWDRMDRLRKTGFEITEIKSVRDEHFFVDFACSEKRECVFFVSPSGKECLDQYSDRFSFFKKKKL